jgi:hypothetical protein
MISRKIAVVVFAWVNNFHAGREGIGGEAVSVVGLSHEA